MTLSDIPRDENWEANELTQLAYGLRIPEDTIEKIVRIRKRKHPFIEERGKLFESYNTNLVSET